MGKTPEKYRALCIYVALALSTFAVFWQVRHHEFISFDDDLYIYNNNHVKTGLTREGFVWAFTKIHAYNWHPLTWVSHMLDCELYGLKPGGHHFTNVLFHIANALLLLSVLKRMTGSLYSSAFVAALFALHPLHVESVAWASERKDVLSGFFWILTMWAYVRYTERPNVARYLLTVLAFCLGLMAKQMLVTLPFVLLLLDYWPLGRLGIKRRSFSGSAPVAVSVRRCILEKIPLLIFSVVASMVVYFIQHYEGVVKSFVEYPLLYRIANAIVAYVVYIGKMLWPANLAIFYPHQYKDLSAWQITGSALLLVCITTAVLWKVRQKPYLAVGWLWYLGTLVPVIGLVQVGLQAYADRYTYMTLTGLFMIIAWGIPDLLARLRYQKAILSSSAAILLSALGVMAWHQVRYWRNDVTLYRHATVVIQDNWWAHNFLGKVLEGQGKLDEAIAHLTEVLRIDPSNADAKNSLGKALLQQGKFDEAVKLYQQFLPPLPNDINAPDVVDLAWTRWGRLKLSEVVRVYTEAHADLGKALFQRGEVNEAIRHYEEVLRFRPEFVDTHKDLGSTLLQQGKLEEAIRVYQKVLRILPDDPDAHGGLGIALSQQGKLDEAITHFTRALAIEPTSADAHSNLGYALLLKDRLDEAITHFSEAVRLDPNSATAHYNLGNALESQGKFDEAVREYQKFLQIMPDDPNVLNTLGIVLGRQGKLDEAIKYFTEALRVKPDFAEARSNLRRAQVLRDKLDEVK